VIICFIISNDLAVAHKKHKKNSTSTSKAEVGPAQVEKSYGKYIVGLVIAISIALMALGVSLTHPIKNFHEKFYIIWLIVFGIVLPITLGLYFYMRRNINFENKDKVKGKSNNADLIDGCSYCSLDGFEEGFLIVLLVLLFIFAEVGISFLLVFIEFNLLKILRLKQKDIPIWFALISNTILIAYITYFISYFMYFKVL
jgi:hypothetical protein